MIDFTQVDRTLALLCEQGKIPSATLCVYHKGRVVHEGAYGCPDPVLFLFWRIAISDPPIVQLPTLQGKANDVTEVLS